VELDVPKGWSGLRRVTWLEVVVPLAGAGRVALEDRPTCEAFVLSVVTMREAQVVLDSEGYFVESPNGYRIAHPAVAVRDKAMAEVRAWSARFGCTMRDRDVLRLGTGEPEQPAEEKMRRGMGAPPSSGLRVVS